MFYFGPDYAANKNARIVSRTDRTGKLRTETQRRDFDSTKMAVSTDTRNDSTNVFIDPVYGQTIKLSGREARTLYRMLQKHYAEAGKVA
jgi:hypothetical protein